jgi:hypothetical protein
LSFNANTGQKDFKAGGNYTDVLPSASKFAATPNTVVRIVQPGAVAARSAGHLESRRPGE